MYLAQEGDRPIWMLIGCGFGEAWGFYVRCVVVLVCLVVAVGFCC